MNQFIDEWNERSDGWLMAWKANQQTN